MCQVDRRNPLSVAQNLYQITCPTRRIPSVDLTALWVEVRPILKHAGHVWDPFKSTNVEQHERVQKMRIWVICWKYQQKDSVHELYTSFGLPFSHLWCKILRLVLMNALINKHPNIDTFNILPPIRAALPTQTLE